MKHSSILIPLPTILKLASCWAPGLYFLDRKFHRGPCHPSASIECFGCPQLSSADRFSRAAYRGVCRNPAPNQATPEKESAEICSRPSVCLPLLFFGSRLWVWLTSLTSVLCFPSPAIIFVAYIQDLLTALLSFLFVFFSDLSLSFC